MCGIGFEIEIKINFLKKLKLKVCFIRKQNHTNCATLV